MSVIGRKPFINTIIDECNKTQVESIVALLNNLGTPSLVALYGDDNLISSANIGVNYVTLKMNEVLALIPTGILIYLDNSHCGFFVVNTNSDNITEYVIDPVARTYLIVNEYLTVEELRQVCGDRLVEVGGGITVQVDDIDSGSATEGQTLVANGQGGAVWGDAGGGLPEATAPNKVIVSNDDLEFVEKDSVPLADMADNLVAPPETNDALYSNGPTGGLADIATGEEAYLSEVKGYSIVWNQLCNDSSSIILNSSHIYVRVAKNNGELTYYTSSSTSVDGRYYKVYDLTLMFGGNDKIPFSLTNGTEYPQNGTMTPQTYSPLYGFSRLFANVDLATAPYDAGTIKNVSATKLVETGQNLWDASTMGGENGTGLKLLAGYRYEMYLDFTGSSMDTSAVAIYYVDGSGMSSLTFTRVQNASGKYFFQVIPQKNGIIKDWLLPIVYVGFVHSGNYVLGTGTINDNNKAKTNATIPAYVKHEYDVNVSGLNGIPDDSDNHCSVYDTTDYKRVEKIDDLSTLTWTAGSGTYSATISGIKPSTTHLLATKYLGSEMSVDENGVLTITTSSSPTGSLLYELAEPVSTGNPAFEPIPLKNSQGKWIVNDMGSEYFTQPAGANCPVNQTSTYFANLKDKLVNFEIPEITGTSIIQLSYAGQYASSSRILYPALNQLKIGEQIYRLIPQGTLQSYTTPQNENDYLDQLAIGAGSSVSGHAIAIGRSAYANHASVVIGQSTQSGNGQYSVSVGYNTLSKAYYSVALGYGAVSYIQYGVSFDGTGAKSTCKTINLYDADKIFFRNAQQSSSKTSFASYTQGHTLAEYIQLQTLAGTWDEYGEFLSTATNFNNSEINGVEIVITLIDSNSSLAFRGSCIVEKYNQTFGSVIPTIIYPNNDTAQEIDVSINSDGQIYIDATAYNNITNCDIKEVKYHLL